MTNHFNGKYKQRGSIFQGAYRSRTIESDSYFQYVVAYVLVKNTFELYPRGGLKGAISDFDAAWEWGLRYSFSSLGSFIRGTSRPILDTAVIEQIIQPPHSFKSFAKDVILGGKWEGIEFE